MRGAMGPSEQLSQNRNPGRPTSPGHAGLPCRRQGLSSQPEAWGVRALARWTAQGSARLLSVQLGAET